LNRRRIAFRILKRDYTMTINQDDMAKMFAAFMASQGAAAPAKMTKAEAARAKRMAAHTLSQEAQEEVAEAEEVAADTGKDTLYALRHGAVSGYGAITRYGVGLNSAFGKGWTMLRKTDGGNAAAMWERVEQERRSFVALCKSRGISNPANYWSNAKKAAVAAEGGAKKGTPEARPLKERILSDAGKLLVALYRDAANGKQAANVRKAGELLEGAIQTLGGDLAALKAQSKKALPGQPKGS
jgi:hypothetical protein